MLSETDIRELVTTYGTKVNEGRSIRQLIEDGELTRLEEVSVLEGKVSDSILGDALHTPGDVPIRLMYRCNRISTHDRNRGEIPFKDQVLAENHAYMLGLVRDYIGTSQFDIPGLAPSATVIASENLEMFAFEHVLRRYMAESSTSTSLYQHWLTAKAEHKESFFYGGHTFRVDELAPNGLLREIMDTPSTKAGSDQTVSPAALVNDGVLTLQQYEEIRDTSRLAFAFVSDTVRKRGMILVDTKTEHGWNMQGKIVSADELYTMDSSRYWKMEDDGSVLMRDGKPVSFSKEFARGMVKAKDDVFSPEQANEIAVRYITGLQQLTGKEFVPDLRPREQRIVESTNQILDYLL